MKYRASALAFLLAPLAALALAGASCGTQSAAGPMDDAGPGSADASGFDSADSGGSSTVVTVAGGSLQGIVEGATVSFRGIPYASAPVGARRWKRPAAPTAWAGIRDATAFGHICPQIGGAGAQVGDEDCLFLNVWTPSPRPSSPLPVIVFIHGGDWIYGSGSLAAYDGTLLAEAGPAVVVTINYRLGATGFLALPELAAEDPNGSTGDYGLLDQQAALGWVQQNIAAFGGDPARVTMWGQSAGAWSTFMHLGSPLGRGLFATAFAESGGTGARDLATAESAVGSVYASALGCAGDAGAALLSCLRAVPGSKVALPAPSGHSWGPVIDGYVLTEPVTTTFAAGRQAHVPVLLGTTSREYGSAGLPVTPPGPPVASVTTVAEYEAAVPLVVGASNAAQVLAQYPASAYPSAQAAYIAMLDDWGMLCPQRRVSRALVASQAEPVWRYLYSHTDSTGPLATAGAVHAADLPFWFGTFPSFHVTPDSAETALSVAMAGYLTRFASTGDPNGSGSDAVAWPAYAAGADPYLGLADVPIAGVGIDTSACDFWDHLP